MSSIYDWSIHFILAFQQIGEWLLLPMLFFSFLGTEQFYLLFIPILYWCIDTTIGLRVSLILGVSNCLKEVLKLVFHQPRPFWYNEAVQARALETSFGIPSGHALLAAAVWGMLAASAKRKWVRVIALLLILLIGLSRLYLAVHFPTDVVFGWLIGFLLVWLFLRFERPFLDWLNSLKMITRLVVVFAISLGFIGLGVLARWLLADWQIPAIWLENFARNFPEEPPLNPIDLSSLVSTAGVLFGFSAGAIWIFAGSGFDAGGPIWKRLLRYVLGMLGGLVLFMGLDAIFPKGQDWLAFTLRYLRYALTGFWMTGLAPLIFIRLKLADPTRK
jgi:membrane-associated phospholipid phosphatase